MELAEEDLDFGLDEEEEREWAAYDEDVRQYQQLMSSVGMTADELREAAVARSDEAAQSGGSGASFLGQAPEGLTDDEVSRLEEVLGNMELDVGQEAARQGEQAQGEPPLREFLKERPGAAPPPRRRAARRLAAGSPDWAPQVPATTASPKSTAIASPATRAASSSAASSAGRPWCC
ncbi:unnamed protein product [Prorocentrum cordatum]|uniref:Uncharacterized protein n=1 Tax=Prorocentrum cordatum TaxID=2364126 RepID=A0ABN9UQM8_9DINO|nr:unnamed protein product [Polarella glacialis]